MKNLGELQAHGYGVVVFSPEKLNRFLKARKCRAKKYLTYFDKNKDIFFDLIKAGVLLPFYRISRFEYVIFATVNEPETIIPKGYEKIYHYENFYVQVENGKLCLACFDFLENHKVKIDNGQTDYGKEIPAGAEEVMEWYNYAIGLELESGDYQFDVYGLKRTELNKRESKNYAFIFAFRKVKNFVNDNFNKCDNDQYDFNIDNR